MSAEAGVKEKALYARLGLRRAVPKGSGSRVSLFVRRHFVSAVVASMCPPGLFRLPFPPLPRVPSPQVWCLEDEPLSEPDLYLDRSTHSGALSPLPIVIFFPANSLQSRLPGSCFPRLPIAPRAAAVRNLVAPQLILCTVILAQEKVPKLLQFVSILTRAKCAVTSTA